MENGLTEYQPNTFARSAPMTDTKKLELLKLAEQWRNRASEIDVKYRDKFPGQTKNVVDMIELCAQELEEIAKQ